MSRCLRRRCYPSVPALVAALLAALLMLPATAAAAAPTGEWWFTQMSIGKAQKISKGAGVTVAVIDSGVKASLGDLRGQVLPGTDLTGQSTDGRVDEGPSDDPKFGHGTNMAVLIAGTGKGTGIEGVAPAAKILPVRIPLGTNDDWSSSATDMGNAIRWAVDHHAQIVNISLGKVAACDPATQAAVLYALAHNVIVVAASGDQASSPVNNPANCVGVIAVGGVAPVSGQQMKSWPQSSRGAQVDLVGPAQSVPGEWLDGTRIDTSGTSAATAVVSGVFALVRSHFPHESARQIVTRVLWNVHNGPKTDFAHRINDALGYGEPLPYYALTVNPPARAANPIFDAIDAYRAAHPGTSHSAPDSAPASTTGQPSSSADRPSATTSAAGAASGGGSGVSPVLIVLIVVVVLVLVLVSLLLVRRRGRQHA